MHIVVSINKIVKECYVITVFEPDTRIWQKDFKFRVK